MDEPIISALTSHDSLTENGAASHSTSGSSLLDYFYKAGSYRGRSENDVYADVSKAYAENPELTLKAIFYNRLITRKSKGDVKTQNVQKGQGNKDEFIKSLKWLELTHPGVLQRNLWLVPVVGCWKDLWYDSPETDYFFYVSPKNVYELITMNLKDDFNRPLIAKFLPKYRSKSNTTTERHKRLNAWVRNFLAYSGWSEISYRKFKSNPEHTAHLFQRQMSNNQWDKIDFNRVPGKALFNLISRFGKKDRVCAIERHKQTDRYLEWAGNKGEIQFTGYVYELFSKAVKSHGRIQELTYDAQFETLLKRARDSNEGLKENVLCALDTSASMTWYKVANNITPLDVCLSLGIFFSTLNEGFFKDYVVAFSNKSRIAKLSGSFADKCRQSQALGSGGSTNFMSVIDELVRVRKSHPEIPVEQFPTTLLVVSDMQFNPTGGFRGDYSQKVAKTNYEEAVTKMVSVDLPMPRVIWWQVNGAYGKDVPNKMDDKGVVLISGFDPSIVTTILGGNNKAGSVPKEAKEITPWEAMEIALDQEILDLLKLG